MKRMQERFYNQYQEDTMEEEGEVTIESQSKNNNSKNDIDAEYVDFDEMEYEPIIASALDIYAHEMTTYSGLNPMLRIKCPNEEIKSVLDSLYFNIVSKLRIIFFFF